MILPISDFENKIKFQHQILKRANVIPSYSIMLMCITLTLSLKYLFWRIDILRFYIMVYNESTYEN